MRRLRSPGGCPWDARQTPESLAPYLLEETHEVLEALHHGDSESIRDELGDLLLQVVFQARIFEERGEFDFGDVAEGIAAKLVRRHPHVFGSAEASSEEDLHRQWEQIKHQEKKHRHRPGSLLADIPQTLPGLSLARKALERLERRFGNDLLPKPENSSLWTSPPGPETDLEDGIGDHLLELVELARRHGLDAETALRKALSRLEQKVDEPSSPF